jgi:hypothetical protein
MGLEKYSLLPCTKSATPERDPQLRRHEFAWDAVLILKKDEA